MVHAARYIGRVIFNGLKSLGPGGCQMAPVQHIGPRQNHSTCHHRIIISDQKTALTRIQVLIGLGRITPDNAVPPRPSATPFRPHGMGAIFNDLDVGRTAKRQQAVHITNMAAHVA